MGLRPFNLNPDSEDLLDFYKFNIEEDTLSARLISCDEDELENLIEELIDDEEAE